MYESQTFETILNRMLDRVPNDVDKREGSIIYNALAPAAAELAQAYIELDVILNETFADTATRSYLIRRAAERGVTPDEAKKAILKGVFKDASDTPLDVPIGSRYSLEDLNYKVIEKNEDGEFKLECETAGTVGNELYGSLIPIEYVPGLATAELTELLIPGENEEDTEVFRQRYLDSLQSEAYGGNISDYKEKVKKIQGVGGVKVYPVWDGGGTVKLVIMDSNFDPPSPELINFVQETMDPVAMSGKGVGVAPIGHVVTVVGVETVPVAIATVITFEEGYTWPDIEPTATTKMEEYLKELRETWEDESALVVRVSQIEVRLLDLTGVLDIADTTINGLAQNLILDADEVPVLDVITA
jgi:uncharacterized phage protein gp47/JayE